MIPKVIHYVWLGKKEKPEKIKNAMVTWQKVLGQDGYKIIEWNERNWDISQSRFASENYKAGKYAYVSDVIRLDVLYRYGGIYLDTDMLVKKNFDPFLNKKAFWGMMYDDAISTNIIGTEEKNNFIKYILDKYQNYTRDMIVKGELSDNNNMIISKDFIDYYPEFKLKNIIQELHDGTYVFPKEYFSFPTYNLKIDYAEHLFTKTWSNEKYSRIHYLTRDFVELFFGKIALGKVQSYRGAKRYVELKKYENEARKNGH